jgi:hypothetical protein
MTDMSLEPDESHRIGPLPSMNALRPMGTFAKILERGVPEAGEWMSNLGLPPEYAPEIDCFVSGLDLFEHKHSSRLGSSPHLPALLALGRDLWRARLAAKEDSAACLEEVDEDDEVSEEGWTAERFAGWLEGLCLRSSYWIRRSRWLCLLSESCLSWADRTDGKKTLVVFAEGDIHRRENHPVDMPVPAPPGHTKSIRERQSSFDIGTYDRLVIVTTELRRLLSEGRKIELKLGPKSSLRNEQIAKGLQWV